MYEYMKGQVTFVSPYYIVLEVGGIGYQLAVANPFRYNTEVKETLIYVYQSVREDSMTLFGFNQYEEKQLFMKLISVSGIGPKSALAIMAGEDHVGLVKAVESDDFKYLTKFPGVGKKTAQQMILDLKGKLDDLVITELTGEEQLSLLDAKLDNVASRYLEEALEALLALGYSQKELARIEKELTTLNLESTDAFLRQGLSLLMKK
ncbi:Holliday junction branch migration protein RuvA [Vagococcus xieshaowenii]|uniref:Holliday junction branch migration complex subunit RuvA n=1 Tax=Vagococcus xieshaowenii TaxID=2562451 RepID=A0A4Z0D8P1_9ENTE|nr:Holliday junction branch migration protein RuvA [Vagococcus xieshaowenii]QCA27985.1 Holliday junction branch migration protein RuvA [Vagococcus xieshaowenii]TFZ41248.1 Holliday junction branch migration protein RuvA [Vagococcus xieshaowenii]